MAVKTILIVDDNEGDQFLAKMQLLRFDPKLKIRQVYDGVEALELLDTKQFTPDIILLDINMPRMNGHEFLAQYSKRENQPKVIVMLSSSCLQNKDKDDAFKYACTKSYIEKSLDCADVEQIMMG